jgi:predicted amidohydrolase
MWENCFYVGGEDDGVLEAEGKSVGVALCWELMRSQTARRLRGRVDVVLAGSGWWSVMDWRPGAVFRRLEARNATLARRAAESSPPTSGRRSRMRPTPVGSNARRRGCRCATGATSRAARSSATPTARSRPVATGARARGSRSPRSAPSAARRWRSPRGTSGSIAAACSRSSPGTISASTAGAGTGATRSRRAAARGAGARRRPARPRLSLPLCGRPSAGPDASRRSDTRGTRRGDEPRSAPPWPV